MKPIYVVDLDGIPEFNHDRLYDCLVYIGSTIVGKRQGSLLVTVKEAIEAGFSIRVC